jgi:hypothetical protein
MARDKWPLRVRATRSQQSLHDHYLRIPAKDPRRFGSDSGYLVADPVGHQVRFSPLIALESLKSG